jgi:hypothetical protein
MKLRRLWSWRAVLIVSRKNSQGIDLGEPLSTQFCVFAASTSLSLANVEPFFRFGARSSDRGSVHYSVSWATTTDISRAKIATLIPNQPPSSRHEFPGAGIIEPVPGDQIGACHPSWFLFLNSVNMSSAFLVVNCCRFAKDVIKRQTYSIGGSAHGKSHIEQQYHTKYVQIRRQHYRRASFVARFQRQRSDGWVCVIRERNHFKIQSRSEFAIGNQR